MRLSPSLALLLLSPLAARAADKPLKDMTCAEVKAESKTTQSFERGFQASAEYQKRCLGDPNRRTPPRGHGPALKPAPAPAPAPIAPSGTKEQRCAKLDEVIASPNNFGPAAIQKRQAAQERKDLGCPAPQSTEKKP